MCVKSKITPACHLKHTGRQKVYTRVWGRPVGIAPSAGRKCWRDQPDDVGPNGVFFRAKVLISRYAACLSSSTILNIDGTRNRVNVTETKQESCEGWGDRCRAAGVSTRAARQGRPIGVEDRRLSF